MQNIYLKELPTKYYDMLSRIKDDTVRMLYSKFKFYYFESKACKETITDCNDSRELNKLSEDDIFYYLEKFSFITYSFSKDNLDNKSEPKKYTSNKQNINQDQDSANESKSDIFDVTICVEKECLIIKEMETSTIDKLMNYLKRKQISILNMNENYQREIKTDPENIANSEINSFCSYSEILNEIRINEFVKNTIRAISGYLIRRYFYPSEYFRDQTFFIFEQTKMTKYEQNLKQTLLKSIIEDKLAEFSDQIQENESQSKEVQYNTFQEKEFIPLRTIYNNNQGVYDLVIHKRTLYIFIMKKYRNPDNTTKDNRYEINFCKNYSHRCFVHFYGFISKGKHGKQNAHNEQEGQEGQYEQITGIIYEYMSNGTLKSYVESNGNQISNTFSFTTIIRIFEGINYLHTNCLIHRDLKPSNILLDHDNIAYISDFPTIRHIQTDEEPSEYTGDLGSLPYMSPEQYSGKFISYSTDIYSFGMILYFLIEKKHMNTEINSIKQENHHPQMTTSTSTPNLQHLFETCIEYEPTKRITHENIKKIIINETKSFQFYNNFNNIKEIIQNILETFIIQTQNTKETTSIATTIQHFQSSFSIKFIFFIKPLLVKTFFSFFLLIGLKYYSGKNITCDIDKSIHYFTLSANQNDSNAQYLLGEIYYEAKYITRDIDKSIHYLTLSANQNNSYAQYLLGKIYYEANYITRDINKSIHYLTLSANQNNSYAQYLLGEIYYEANYTTRDIDKSIHYLTLSANQNNSNAQYLLGEIYYEAKYITSDINKSIYYLTLSANQNHSVAQYLLGEIYYEAKYTTCDINKSIHYLTLSANQNNSYAQCFLGKIYYEANYTTRDINKSIHYLTLSANQNNSYAQYLLGEIYYEAKYTTRDINKSIHYLTLSANQNNSNAQYLLGKIYYEAKYITRDINKSIHYLTLSANQNDSHAQYLLGKIYNEAKYITRDINKSIHYLTLSANQNHSYAQYLLGEIYYEAKYTTRDINKSIHYLTLSANQNNSYAQCFLGKIYYEANYITRDIDKSIHYLTLSANQNDSYAQYLLGKNYYEAKYITRDINKSIHYLTLSANQNNSNAQRLLGGIYYLGKYITRDINKSIHYLTLSANQNDSYAHFLFGIFYYFGKYITRDINKSIHYLTLSANQNNSSAQYLLGEIYYEAKYTKRDINKSIHYLTLSANQNNSSVQYLLGEIYYKANYTTRDIDKSIHYLTLSANQNNSYAQCLLGAIYYFGKYITRDINKSINCLTLSANQNDSYSQCLLGIIYYEAKYITRDINKSIHYLTLSANQNNSCAQFFLGEIYYFDIYIASDINKSIHYLTLSANQNNSCAQCLLGKIYYEAKYITRDINKSIHYFTLSANQNNSYAQYLLGEIYYEANYTTRDINKSIHYLTLSANQNNSYAQYLLGEIYYEANYTTSDINKSIHYLTLSANQNNSRGQYCLAIIYILHKPIQNIKKGLKYLQYSAYNEYRDAQLILGDLHFEGKLMDYSIEKAIHYYKEVSSFNNQYAKNNLGVIYKNGLDDSKKGIGPAIEYFEEAIRQKNDALSKFNLSNVLLDERPEKRDYTKINKLLIESYLQGIDESLVLLCFSLIQKYESINYQIIKNEIKEYCKKPTDLALVIYQCYEINSPEDYQEIRETNLVYIMLKILTLEELERSREHQESTKASNLKDINSKFYEGFDIDI